jgi:putative DNA primase/helicase
MAWAIRGAAQVLTNVLNDPPSVLAATEDYRISEDSLAGFVRDECLLGPNWWCKVQPALRRDGSRTTQR